MTDMLHHLSIDVPEGRDPHEYMRDTVEILKFAGRTIVHHMYEDEGDN